MKSFAVFQVPGYIVALLGSTGVQAVANPGLNFAAVTSTLTAFGTRFSNLPTVSSPSTTTVVISAVAVDDFQNQMSTTSVVELTRSRTSTISITLSRTLSDTKVNIPTSIALDSNKTTIPSSIPSLVPSPTSSASTKKTGPSPHRGIFVSLLSSQSTAVVLPVNSLSGIPPITSSNTVTTIFQPPNPVQKVALTTPNSDVDDELTIPPRSTVFTTIYPLVTVTDIFTATSSQPLSNLPSDRNNPNTAAVLDLLTTGPSLKENTALKRILSRAKNVTYFSPTTFISLSPPVQALLSQSHSLSTLSSRLTSSDNKSVYTKFLTVPSTTIFSSIFSPNLPPGNKSTYTKFLTVPSTTIFSSILSSNLPPSGVSTYTKFLTVPSTTITQQFIPATSAPQSSRSSSSISIFRGIFRNLSLPSTRADTDDSSFASPTSPSPPNNNNSNSSSSVLLVSLPPSDVSTYTKFLTVPSTTIFSSILSSNLPPSGVSTYTKFLTVPSTSIFSSILSSNLPPSGVSTYTKFLTVPSTTITQQSIPTASALNNIPAPQLSRSGSPNSIFRGIFRNLLLPSTRADTDDSSFASPTSPSPPNHNNNNSSSSVLLVRRRTIEDDVMPSLSSSHSSRVPSNDNNNKNDILPTPISFLAWSANPGISIFNLFRTEKSLFRTDEKAKTTMYPADNNSKKTAEQQPVRTEPSLTQSASPTTTVSVIVMPTPYNKPMKTWSISTSH